jgi:hypothetical protein
MPLPMPMPTPLLLRRRKISSSRHGSWTVGIMGGSDTFVFWGENFPAKISQTQFTHKNQRYCTNHGGRRRRLMEAFRGNYSHDITPTESSSHLLLIYVPLLFFMRPVPFR